MTCREIRAYFEGAHFAALNPTLESAAFLEHTTECGECRGFVEEQKELAKALLLLRERVPETTAAFDKSVLAQYRTYISEAPRSTAAFASAARSGRVRPFRWAAAVAFAVFALAGALVFIAGQRTRVNSALNERRPVKVDSATVSTSNRTAAMKPVPKKRSAARSPTNASEAILVASPENFSAPEFQGLMFCDQLSCPGAMDVIRVQLPSASFGSASSEANDFVYADVLVGSDGIARGIRVVQ
jgi:hypothetical protein